jgi:hypothetical protein
LRPLGHFGSIWYGIISALQQRHISVLFSLTFSLVAVATVFYHYWEGWRWLDAFYFSVTTIATVGFGDFTPQTDGGKIFTIFYIVAGVGLFVASATAFASHIIMQANRRSDEGR